MKLGFTNEEPVAFIHALQPFLALRGLLFCDHSYSHAIFRAFIDPYTLFILILVGKGVRGCGLDSYGSGCGYWEHGDLYVEMTQSVQVGAA
jgi:hypothetical protein